jgi:hypothetical protein
MSGSVKLTQKMLDTWLEAAWRDGFSKGVDGEDSIPDFSTLDPRGPEDGKKLSPSEAQVAEYNSCKCGARMFREGFGVQCSRKTFGDGLLCKTHQKVIDEQSPEFDLPFGWFNKERPTHHLDQKQHGKPIAWSDMKKASKNSTKKRATAKEMREQLTEMGISIDGLKGKDLTLKYNDVMDSQQKPDENSQSDENSQPEEQHHETPTTPQDTHTLNERQEVEIKTTVEIVKNRNGSETEIHRQELIPLTSDKELAKDSDSESEDPAAGTGLNQLHDSKQESPKKESVPSTTAQFKKLFQELGISTEGLRGKKAFKDKYDEYLEEKKIEDETEDMSDEEDELEKDETNYVEVDFEGIEYLEDEDTSNIYNTSHILVGKWNEDGDDIIWASESAKADHDSKKD